MKRFDYVLNSFFISVKTSSTVTLDLDILKFRLGTFTPRTHIYAVEVYSLNYKIHT